MKSLAEQKNLRPYRVSLTTTLTPPFQRGSLGVLLFLDINVGVGF